jgi:hypothetical protein
MRSPLGIPDAELKQVIEQAVKEYMREIQRIRLRSAIIHVCQAEGRPVPEGEEMEVLIDMLEALFAAGQDDPDKVLHIIDEMDDTPMSMPVSAHANNGKKRKGKRWRKNRLNQ